MNRRAFLVLAATLGGLGFLTRMPGTLGSAAACIFYVLFPVPWWGILALGVLGTWVAGACARAMGVDHRG